MRRRIWEGLAGPSLQAPSLIPALRLKAGAISPQGTLLTAPGALAESTFQAPETELLVWSRA